MGFEDWLKKSVSRRGALKAGGEAVLAAVALPDVLAAAPKTQLVAAEDVEFEFARMFITRESDGAFRAHPVWSFDEQGQGDRACKDLRLALSPQARRLVRIQEIAGSRLLVIEQATTVHGTSEQLVFWQTPDRKVWFKYGEIPTSRQLLLPEEKA